MSAAVKSALPRLGATTATVVAIQSANPAEPGQGPLLVLGPALADRDEIAADVRPAEDQHHVAQLHLGHGFVRRVAVDHQHRTGVRREVALGHFVASGGIEAKDHRVLTQEHPQPPAISRLAFLGDEDHPASFIGLGERGRGIPLE